MRVLMLGWEYPPFISGGLGTACRGLTEAMKQLQTRILFVLPRSIENSPRAVSEEDADDSRERPNGDGRSTLARSGGGVELAPVPSELTNPYQTAIVRPESQSVRHDALDERLQKFKTSRESESSVKVVGVGAEDGYDGDLMGKIHAYADRCVHLTRRELFDIIHAHDWMTFPAAMAIAEFSGRPIVAHIHATEFDRSGEWGNPHVYNIERRGMHAAARIIAVSERTKQIIVDRYDVPAWKVAVVHNGIDFEPRAVYRPRKPHSEKVVLFLGRITRQKGPEYFIRAAARVAERVKNVRFVVAGSGDQLPYVIRLAEELGIRDHVEFRGFLHGPEVDKAYETADVYAMPSVSEPFGLTALEAARHGVPVILSKDSGAAEVLRRGTLKVDFWDVEMMAKMIVAVLHYPGLADTLRRESLFEIEGLTWEAAARKCIRLYYDALTGKGPRRVRLVRESRS
jgi:glycosyltransferase involved in cell wall biosynthesis